MKRDRSWVESSTGEEVCADRSRLCVGPRGVLAEASQQLQTNDHQAHGKPVEQAQLHTWYQQPHVNQSNPHLGHAADSLLAAQAPHHQGSLSPPGLTAQHQQGFHHQQHLAVNSNHHMPSFLQQTKGLARSFADHTCFMNEPMQSTVSPPGHAPIKRSNSCPLLVELEQGGIAIAKEDEQQEQMRQQAQQHSVGLYGPAPKWL
mmetsp:Transcript_9436/g.34637  ORF Transcript_9436/g.34637 Transcript_9436/m.34637 type:complete len:203 (+) Transcript_9436:270-878(+)